MIRARRVALRVTGQNIARNQSISTAEANCPIGRVTRLAENQKTHRRSDTSKSCENAWHVDIIGDYQLQWDYPTEGYDDEQSLEGLFHSITTSDLCMAPMEPYKADKTFITRDVIYPDLIEKKHLKT